MKKFYSKILLFGEYSIIKGSNGLAIPYEKYSGELSFKKSEMASGLSLKELSLYLNNSSILSRNIDTKRFCEDVDRGLCFDSNIPQGYGVGSSGALCASIYEHYGFSVGRNIDHTQEQLRFVQDLMALMESFYHGSSSGLDPLISFVNRPVAILGRNDLEFVNIPAFDKIGNFYLIDTGRSRSTSPLVLEFMRMCSDNSFSAKFESLKLATNKAIESIMSCNINELEKCFTEISRFQYLHMQKMIPKEFRDLWLTGLESKKFFMKLCGAGGGGFLLLYSASDDTSFLKGRSFQKIEN